jgi:hypothetical protein
MEEWAYGIISSCGGGGGAVGAGQYFGLESDTACLDLRGTIINILLQNN